MADGSDTARLKASLRQLLRERRSLAEYDDDNFNILDTRQLADMLLGTTQLMTTLLGAVAAVSLLVRGIGLMHIMLESVTERTHEIRLRLAFGTLEKEFLLQFLIEAGDDQSNQHADHGEHCEQMYSIDKRRFQNAHVVVLLSLRTMLLKVYLFANVLICDTPALRRSTTLFSAQASKSFGRNPF